MILCIFSGCGGKSNKTIASLDDLKGKGTNIAVSTGSIFPEHVLKALPEANILYLNTLADQVNALKSGKADAVALDEPTARNIMSQDDAVTVMSELLEEADYAFIFQKSQTGEELCSGLNEYILKIKNDGTMGSLQKKWFDSGDVSSVERPDYRELNDVNGTLRLVTTDNPPFAFISEGMSAGYDVEIFYNFCKENGYAMEVTDVNMDAMLSGIQSGRYDVGCCGVTVTEERKENMLFSEPDYSGGTTLLIRKESAGSSGNFFTSLADNFYKTFVRENRWKMFLEGIGTTMLITILSILLGTSIGFVVFMICRKGNRVANTITRFCIWLIHGMPVVVLLMILYYIVFGKMAISGTVVSIIGFTLIFAAAVFSMIKAGVGTVERGQMEAAYALGYSNRKAFFRIILPQALPHIMPSYKSEITSLIKATAVVGYVAVQDLTKMGDIVRSQTYEAFFPLISVAVIYFVLAAILTLVVKKIEIRIDPRCRSKEDILKEVNGR